LITRGKKFGEFFKYLFCKTFCGAVRANSATYTKFKVTHRARRLQVFFCLNAVADGRMKKVEKIRHSLFYTIRTRAAILQLNISAGARCEYRYAG
jgi:hypothetical protein